MKIEKEFKYLEEDEGKAVQEYLEQTSRQIEEHQKEQTTFNTSLICELSNVPFPLLNREDLPIHERLISSESLKLLYEGIEEIKRGEVVSVQLEGLEDED
jgi:hypothetical protein